LSTSKKSFALSARELAALPSVISKIEAKIQTSAKEVGEAIISDLPVTKGELQKMRGGPGSSFSHALKIAQKVHSVFLISFFGFLLTFL